MRGRLHTDDIPAEPYEARYAVGFHTDRLLIEEDDGRWDEIFEAVEEWVTNDPYFCTTGVEAADWGGIRILITNDVPHLDAPSMVVYFAVDDTERVVEFRTVEELGDIPDDPDAFDTY